MRLLASFLFVLLTLSFNLQAESATTTSPKLPEDTWQELLELTQQKNLERQLDEEARLKLVQIQATELAAELKATQQALAKAKQERQTIEQEQEQLELQVQEMQQRLQRRSLSLGEVFAIYREEKSNLYGLLNEAMYNQQYPELLKFAQPNTKNERLPQIQDFEQLWQTLQLSWRATAQITTYTAPWVSPTGNVESGSITRLGDLQLMNPQGVLKLADNQLPSLWSGQPTSLVSTNNKFIQGASNVVSFDPVRGLTFELYSRQPTLLERVNQGGFVGYLIIVLGLAGLVIALVQSWRLYSEQKRVQQQLQDLNQINTKNSLGRILNSMNTAKPAALEASLDESLIREGAALEKGLALVKLLAAMAPLLGLLGTVTGMIATFQAITLFGTGDPSLMASGISQALVTTVLGLLTAVPLLLAHLLLNGRSRQLARTLEAESSAWLGRLLAQQPVKE